MATKVDRKEMAHELAKCGKVHYHAGGEDWPYWTVEGSKDYTVQYNAETEQLECDCPDYVYRRNECKHILAALEKGATMNLFGDE